MTLQLGSQSYSPQRIFCIGKNYAEHVKELGGKAPDQPVVFMKPVSCLVFPGETIRIPTHGNNLHHEVEVVVLIGAAGKGIPELDAASHIAGLTLGLDLTLRDVQADMKKKGWPWEISKAFDQSAPLGTLTPYGDTLPFDDIPFQCSVNDVVRQTGNTREMMFSIPHLIHYLSGIWQLRKGDLIFTGTPSGVGSIQSGDRVSLRSELLGTFEWSFS